MNAERYINSINKYRFPGLLLVSYCIYGVSSNPPLVTQHHEENISARIGTVSGSYIAACASC